MRVGELEKRTVWYGCKQVGSIPTPAYQGCIREHPIKDELDSNSSFSSDKEQVNIAISPAIPYK